MPVPSVPHTGTITVTGLTAHGYHGVLPSERTTGQLFVVDVEMEIDWPTVDELSATLDYGAIARRIVSHITGKPVRLIETLASQIANDLATTPGVRALTVCVHKPNAALGVQFDDVRVRVAWPVPRPPQIPPSGDTL